MALMAAQPDDSVLALTVPPRIRMGAAPPTPDVAPLMARQQMPEIPSTMSARPVVRMASPHDEHMAATLTTPIMAAPEPVGMSPLAPLARMSAGPRVTMATDPEEQIEGHLQNRLMSDYRKDSNPWGSPTNHPGFMGKLLHGLNVATGGASRREFDEEGLEKRLEDVTGQEAGNKQKGAQAQEETAQAHNLENPPSTPLPTESGYVWANPRTREISPIEENGKPLMPYQKPGNVQHVFLQGPDGKPIAAIFDPTRQEYRDAAGHLIANPVPYEKPAAEHPTAGTVNGKPAWGVFVQGRGWTDPNSGQPLPGFTPPPTFAQTGLWQPTEGYDPGTGQLVPGKLNERTGAFVPNAAGGGPAPLPKDVTSELGKELQTAREADKRLRIMESNEQAALNGDQQAMVSLVANHIGMTLGAQKGARINQAVWNEAVQSAPWLQRAETRFGRDGYLVGVTLSPDQIRQMVQLGQVVRDNQWQQAEQAFGQYGIPISAPAEEHSGRTGGASPASPAAAKPPTGAKFQGKGSDGKMYWLDANRQPIAEVK